MSNIYDLTFKFYQTLKTAQNKLGNGLALANTDVFYLLANAGWHIAPGDLKELINWYEIMGLPPAVITSGHADKNLTDALKEAGFTTELSFTFRTPEASSDSNIQVEQVSWSQMRYAGELLANHYEQPENAVAISKSLTKALQSSAAIKAYLGYEDEAKGVMITFEDSTYLVAMLSVDKRGALETHMIETARDLGLEPLILEALPTGTSITGEGLHRWSIR